MINKAIATPEIVRECRQMYEAHGKEGSAINDWLDTKFGLELSVFIGVFVDIANGDSDESVIGSVWPKPPMPPKEQHYLSPRGRVVGRDKYREEVAEEWRKDRSADKRCR